VKPRAAISWSGGKDCCSALGRARATYDVVGMVTMFTEDGARTRSHGLRPEIVAAHAQRLGLQSVSGRCSWETYTDEYCRVLGTLVAGGVTHVIFGDIMFDSHRAWNERVCAAHGLTPVLPLWGEPTADLLVEFLASGGEACLITVRADVLDASWLGRTLSHDVMRELQARGLDPCGENGEYHTLVTGTPLFSSPLCIREQGRVRRGSCWSLDVSIDGHASSR
jgi:uncharacterized protein (TIGR00290 family)